MNRRITGLAAAGVLALVGTLILVGYVRNAEARALSGEKLTSVFVVTEPIAAGTKAKDIFESVELEEVPQKVVADGAIDDLKEIDDLVATVDLVPGEQLVAERFAVAPAREGVPDGLLEVTVRLDPERALGGDLAAGDKVAVVSSFEPFDTNDPDPNAPKKTPNMSHLILHKVLVTDVKVTEAVEEADEDEDTPETAPAGQLFVTLAVDAEAVQRIVFTAEHGRLWLSAEPDDAPEVDLIVETLGTVLGEVAF